MIRKTSIEAYRAIMDNGLLSKRREQVYDCLYTYGPLTRNQLSELLRVRYHVTINPNLVSSRLVELRDFGCAYEVKETVCPQTGMTVILWDVTENLPVKPAKKAVEECTACPQCGGSGKVRAQAAAARMRAARAQYEGDAHLQMNMFGGQI